ncbi:MAG: flagellar biosynthetic protein FliO [Planctomycetes bacterium]|nr:flagellar biosynthetic protein FliO [Planctomycetota bacterium]
MVRHFSITIQNIGRTVLHQGLAVAPVAVLLLITATPSFAQTFDGDQSMLRDAKAAADTVASSRYPVSDPNVAPATFDTGVQELPASRSQQEDTTGKPTSKLLPPRPASLRRPAAGSESATAGMPKVNFPSATTLVGSTCVVLSLFFAVAWLLKRAAPKSMQSLPQGAIEVLGRAPLVRGQHLQLVRCGQRLLLLAVSSSTSQTLTEISDAQEVAALLSACGGKSTLHAPREVDHNAERDGYYAKPDRVGELLATVTGGVGSREPARGGRLA